jgi:endonuclease/exonuclease/phosphatase family metal-dependent hydrolase
MISDELNSYASIYAVNYQVAFVPLPITEPMGKVNGGIAMFSRFFPEESYREALPGQYSWPVRLFMLDRCFIFSRFRMDNDNELVIINTHNEAFDTGDMRKRQMEHLRSIMLEEYRKGNYVVAGGDWNINPPGYNESTFKTGDAGRTVQPQTDPEFFPEGWKWTFDPSAPTNRSVDQPYVRGRTPATIIDYFIISPNVNIVAVNTIDLQFIWSDHQPVMLKFTLKH